VTSPAEKKPDDSRSGVAELKPLTTPERVVHGSTKAHALSVRKARSRRLLKRVLLFVVLPTALAATYFGALASNQYESFAQFTVQSSELQPSLGMDLLAGLSGASGSARDALAVRDYVLSRDMLARLDKEHGFIAHYKSARQDWISRLRSDASFELAYQYFDGKVSADFDQVSGSVTVRVRAFDAKNATLFAQSILSYSEEMVNKLSERERRDRTAYAEAQVKVAETRLVKARQAIVELQQKHGDFNPLQTAVATMTLRTQLEGELAKARAELLQLKSYMNDNAPLVLAANEKVKSLSVQVSGESRRLVDPSKPSGLSNSFADFEGAAVEKEFAQKAYETAMATLEVARADADRQHRYVAVIANPSTPDESTYPHRIRSILAALVLSVLVWGVGTMIVAAVREHARL
jgi:capsular polysaccharide transport system permease protein